SEPGTRATVLVALATTGGTTVRRVGKVSRVPPPATALTTPAARADRHSHSHGASHSDISSPAGEARPPEVVYSLALQQLSGPSRPPASHSAAGSLRGAVRATGAAGNQLDRMPEGPQDNRG